MEFLELSLEEIEQLLTEKKIPYNTPGFYDHPNFLEQESKNSKFIEIYAAYVYKRKYSDEYLKYAESTIIKISEIFSEALKRNNCLGACIDTSNTVIRILDHFGIWNFGISGCLTMAFPTESKLNNTSFHHFDVGNYEAGHAWLFCPPFNVVDLTIRHQSYCSKEVINYLPEYVANRVKTIANPKLSDVVSPLVEAALDKVKLQTIFNEVLRFQKVIRTLEFRAGNTEFRYIPIAIGLPLEPLQQFRNLKLDDLYPYDFYMKNIKDKLLYDEVY